MKSIGGFFDKFNSNIAKKVGNHVYITEAIAKHTGIKIDITDISMQNGILRVKATAVEKNEIFLKKAKILKELEGKLQSLRISDIK